MERKLSRTSKDKNKKEVLYRKPPEAGNVNQNTGSSGNASLSSFLVNEFQRSKIHVEPSIKKLTKAEEAIQKAKEDNEERKERRQDMTELQAMWDKNVQLMKELTEAKIVQAKWDRYMRCDGSPDPVNQREINTYISLRQEDKSRDNVICVLEDSQMDLQLIQELQFLLLNSPVDVVSDVDRNAYIKTIEELRNLIMSKLDMATLQVMCDATILAHKETGNLQYAASIGDIALCIWGNIMKNPRIRSFEFTEVLNYSFDIPKALALTDCAVRILTTKFDNYSPTSKAIVPRLKKNLEAEPVEPEPKEEKKEDGEEKEHEGGSKDQAEEEPEEKEPPIIKLNMIGASVSAIAEEAETREDDMQVEIEEDYPDPSTPEPAEWEEFDEEDDAIDLRAYSVLGRIYHFDLLQLPPQPKIVGSWTITQLVDPPVISFLEYMADSPGGQEGGKDSRREEKPPISVSIILPNDVLSLEQPQVAHWDKHRKLWTTVGISDISYLEDPQTVAFKTNHFGTFCFIQDKHINLPFASWDIRPHSIDSAVFTIASMFIEIEIEIKGELCCLSGPTHKPELASIRDKWATPSELIKMMMKAGLNFFPSEDSIKFVDVVRKNPLTEERMYQQMAMTAAAMAYSWSKWNRQGTDYNEITFLGAEALVDEPVSQDAWSVFMATKRRVTKLKESEEHTEMKEKLASEASNLPSGDESPVVHVTNIPSRVPHMRRASAMKSQRRSKVKEELKTPRDQFLEAFTFHKPEFKSNIYHLVTSTGSEAAVARIKNTNLQFANCVYKLLTATRILSYS